MRSRNLSNVVKGPQTLGGSPGPCSPAQATLQMDQGTSELGNLGQLSQTSARATLQPVCPALALAVSPQLGASLSTGSKERVFPEVNPRVRQLEAWHKQGLDPIPHPFLPQKESV